MTPQTHLDLVQELVNDALGDEGYAHDEGSNRFHPQSLHFYSDDPDADFDGFTAKPIFEVNLVTDENDDDHKYRLERKDGVLFYTVYHRGSDRCTYNAAGQALVCEPGSDAESVFCTQAAADVALEAASPLRSAMDAIRQGGLQLSHTVQQELVKQLFGA